MYIYHPSLFTNLEVDFSKEILQPPLRSKPLAAEGAGDLIFGSRLRDSEGCEPK